MCLSIELLVISGSRGDLSRRAGYVRRMVRFVFAAVLGAAAVAQAQPSSPPAGKPAAPPAARLPAVHDTLGLDGFPGTPKLDWLYDVPSPGDAAGKVVIHWF